VLDLSPPNEIRAPGPPVPTDEGRGRCTLGGLRRLAVQRHPWTYDSGIEESVPADPHHRHPTSDQTMDRPRADIHRDGELSIGAERAQYRITDRSDLVIRGHAKRQMSRHVSAHSRHRKMVPFNTPRASTTSQCFWLPLIWIAEKGRRPVAFLGPVRTGRRNFHGRKTETHAKPADHGENNEILR